MSGISVDRCRRLVDDLRRSGSLGQDNRLLREFERELDEHEANPVGRPDEQMGCVTVAATPTIIGQTSIDDFLD